MVEETWNRILVLDGGSSSTKCTVVNCLDQQQHLGTCTSIVEFPTVVGKFRPYATNNFIGEENGSVPSAYVGDEAVAKRGILRLKYPVEHGLVTNWDDMEIIWRHAFFNELRVDPEDHPVLLTEQPLTPKANRERVTQMMFEVFSVSCLQIVQSAVLSLLSADGRTTGIVVDGSSGHTTIVPVYQGHIIPKALERPGPGGRDVTDFLMAMLRPSKHCPIDFTSRRERDIARDLKEKHCYVASKHDDLLSCQPITPHLGSCGFKEPEVKREDPPISYSFKLPSGKVKESPEEMTIRVGKERFQCCECLFRPSLLGREKSDGIFNILNRTLSRCEAAIQREMYMNIVLTGGTMMLPGMSERLKYQFEELRKHGSEVVSKLGVRGQLKYLPGSLVFLMCAKKANQQQQQHSSAGGTVEGAAVHANKSVLHTLPDFLLRYVLSFHCANIITVTRDKYAAVRGGIAFVKEEYAKNVVSDWAFKHEYDENGPTIMHTKCVY
jgi:actin